MNPALRDLLQHTAALRRLASDLVGAHAADDVLQDAAIVAMRCGTNMPAVPRSWWFGTVRNLAGKRRRAERARRRNELAAAVRDDAQVDRTAEAADSMRWLTEQLTSLPEPYRSTLLGRYVRDLSPGELAAESGEPVRTIKTRLQRGLALLRERFAARGGDWRAGLVAAFGLERAVVPTAGATAGATAAVLSGAILMNTTGKLVVAAAVLLSAGLLWWQPWREASTGVPVVRSDGPGATLGELGELAEPEPAVVPASSEAAAPPPLQREAVPPTEVPAAPAADDQIVVQVHDADDGQPIVDFALRRHRSANLDLFARETPLLFAGEHAGGRLVLPVNGLGRDNFVVEGADSTYLPSRWFDAADVRERDGQRIVDIALQKPVEQVVRVVLDGASTPIADSVVELLRPWPGHEPVTLRTNALTSDRLRAQVDEPAVTVAWTGGRALLLQRATTDADGRVTLRVPPDEDLALRLLGPGHQPLVETSWRVERSAAAVERVVAVRGGASIEFRAFPPETLRALQLPPLPDEWRERIQLHPAVMASYTVGVWLRNPVTKETRPAQQGLAIPAMPFDDAGRLRVDGLEPGDWVPTFNYPLRCGPPMENPLGGWATCRVELPTVSALQPNELRIVDLDLNGYLPGTLQATVVLNGHARLEGAVLFTPIDATGVPLPKLQGNLVQVDADERVVATLPPARYFATWTSSGKGAWLSLGEFAIASGQPTVHTFFVDPVAVQVRVLDADGGPAPAGSVVVERPGLRASGDTDASGLATVPAQLRGDTLRVSYCPRIGELPNVTGNFGPPIALGELTAGATTETVTLRLPKR